MSDNEPLGNDFFYEEKGIPVDIIMIIKAKVISKLNAEKTGYRKGIHMGEIIVGLKSEMSRHTYSYELQYKDKVGCLQIKHGEDILYLSPLEQALQETPRIGTFVRGVQDVVVTAVLVHLRRVIQELNLKLASLPPGKEAITKKAELPADGQMMCPEEIVQQLKAFFEIKA